MSKQRGVAIRPFRGLRPAAGLDTKVCSLPYDVVDSEEARHLAHGNQYSFFRVNKAEINLEPGTPYNDPKVYEVAKDVLDEFIQKEYLAQEEKPAFYLYALTYQGYTQNGIVSLCSAAQYDQNMLMKHEETREIRVVDRSKIVMIQRANVGPVFFTYRHHESIQEYIANVKKTTPVHDFTSKISAVSDDLVRHQLWVVDDMAKVQQLMGLFDSHVKRLYIADGHHRAASAARVAHFMRGKDDQMDEQHHFFLSVMFPDDELRILDYNRVVRDLNGLTEEEFMKAIENVCEVKQVKKADAKPERRHFSMFFQGNWYNLMPKTIPPNPVDFIDSAVLTDLILRPILAIGDLKKDRRISFIGGIRGYKALEQAVSNGGYAVAFGLAATSMDDLMTVSDKGLLMPPKSTWFEPKLLSGLIGRKFDEEKVVGGPCMGDDGKPLPLSKDTKLSDHMLAEFRHISRSLTGSPSAGN